MYKNSFKLLGFTLAEVLITLGIIGIIAAITIPTLMNNIADMQYKTAYKKAYSAASQAWLKAYSESLLTPRTADINDTINDDNFSAFESEFSVIKDCPSGSTYNCWSTDGYYWQVTYPNTTAHAFMDKSGMVWSQPTQGHYFIFVDINGAQKPNDWGKDRFPFFPSSDCLKVGVYNKDLSAGTTACPNTAHDCYYNSWISGG